MKLVRNNEFIRNVVGFEVLTAVVAMSSVFWNITLCVPLKVRGEHVTSIIIVEE
jgi:hypothetical protein